MKNTYTFRSKISEAKIRPIGLYLKDGGIASPRKNGHTKQSRYAHQGNLYFPTKEKKRRPCGTILNWLA
ncbi:MAG: hypothetical protein PHI96_04015, partial [Desulfovibrio sp.]|nr:hypothetical protein [Desulfovibrio sp.]